MLKQLVAIIVTIEKELGMSMSREPFLAIITPISGLLVSLLVLAWPIKYVIEDMLNV
jgi:hypothetical protein